MAVLTSILTYHGYHCDSNLFQICAKFAQTHVLLTLFMATICTYLFVYSSLEKYTYDSIYVTLYGAFEIIICIFIDIP